MQKFKEPEAEVKRQLIIVSLTRSSAVAEAARRAVSLKILLSLKVTQGHSNLHR